MYVNFGKRLIDLIVASTLLMALSPIMLVISLAIAVNMGRPVFYSHVRTGFKQRLFRIYKFRTMLDSLHLKDDERITPFGLILRRLSLDELPQLFNVLLGDMSLIGPRPLLPEYDGHYSDQQVKRFLVRPGISGLAQVSGRNGLTWEQKFDYDVEYVSKLSLRLDLKIFFQTIVVVLLSAGFSPAGEEKKFSDR